MLSFFKRNKILSILFIITVLTIILGVFLTAFFDKTLNEEITFHITQIVQYIKSGNYNSQILFKNEIMNNTIYLLFMWLIGMSIIGIPILLFLYLGKLLTLSFEIVFLIKNIKITGILFSFLYVIPKLTHIFLYFFLLNHAIRFSIVLIKMIFFKKSYNLHLIIKRYSFIFLIIEFSSLLVTFIETCLMPKIFTFII